METIEQKVASAILERPTGVLEIAGKRYEIASPSVSTLILVSEIVSTLPVVSKDIPKEDIVASVLHYAKDYGRLGEICAVLILGRKGITEERTVMKVTEERRLFGLIRRRRKVSEKVTIDRKAELAAVIMDEVRPSVMMNVIVRRLRDMEIGDFFGITTSLSEANLLRPTAEVEDRTTASGRRYSE